MLAEHPSKQSALCRDIKHLYHYYLHGPLGRRPGQSGPGSVNDGMLPNIIIQCIHNSHLKWRHNLVDVCDDMESKFLEVRIESLLCIEMHMSSACTRPPVNFQACCSPSCRHSGALNT